MYASTELPVPVRDAKAAALAFPGLPLCGLSAARIQHIPIVDCPDTKPEMTVPPRSNADLDGVHVYRARLRPHEIVTADGVLVTSPARTVVDLARHRSLLAGVAAIDYVLHEKLATADELRDVYGFCRTWPGGPRARRALQLADSRSESPLESISRLIIPQLGFPVPEPQVDFFDEDSRFLGRGDFYWDEFGLVGEADGQDKYGDKQVSMAEKYREEGLEDVRLEVARWGWQMVWSRAPLLGTRLRHGAERGRSRDAAGQPRRWVAVPRPRIVVLS